MSSKKLPPLTSEEDSDDWLYPWERLNGLGFENWWIDATRNPSAEVVRRPSIVRHPSFEDVLANTDLSKLQSSASVDVDEASKASTPPPPDDFATNDFERRKLQLEFEIEMQDDYLNSKFGLYRFLIIRDGNCMYRALAQALVHDQSQHTAIRKEVIQFIKNNREDFEEIIEGNFDEFVKEAGKENAWGSYVELLAVTRLLSINIIIVTGGCPANPDVSVTCHHYNPHNESITPKDTVWLSWLSDGHYDVILDSVVENKQYDEWLSVQKDQVRSDAELAESLAQQDDSSDPGVWLDARETQSNSPEGKKQEECMRTPSSSLHESSCHKKVGSSTSEEEDKWDLDKDEELARTLQEEEDLAYLDQFV